MYIQLTISVLDVDRPEKLFTQGGDRTYNLLLVSQVLNQLSSALGSILYIIVNSTW